MRIASIHRGQPSVRVITMCFESLASFDERSPAASLYIYFLSRAIRRPSNITNRSISRCFFSASHGGLDTANRAIGVRNVRSKVGDLRVAIFESIPDMEGIR